MNRSHNGKTFPFDKMGPPKERMSLVTGVGRKVIKHRQTKKQRQFNRKSEKV